MVDSSWDTCKFCNGKGKYVGQALYCLGCRGRGVALPGRVIYATKTTSNDHHQEGGGEEKKSWLIRFIEKLSAEKV